MQKVTINPSIAVIVDIETVFFGEELEVYFDAASNWLGSYDFRLYNSNVKNSEITNNCTLTIANKLMTLSIKGIEKGTHYYEIWILPQKRIVFKGKLVIG